MQCDIHELVEGCELLIANGLLTEYEFIREMLAKTDKIGRHYLWQNVFSMRHSLTHESITKLYKKIIIHPLFDTEDESRYIIVGVRENDTHVICNFKIYEEERTRKNIEML